MLFKSTLVIQLAALASFVAAAPATRDVVIDKEKCYTISTKVVADNGDEVESFLDSSSAALHTSRYVRDTVEKGTDKGVRFRFPDGNNGPVVIQAHNDHYIHIAKKYVASKVDWWRYWKADADKGNTDVLKVYISGDGVILKQGGAYVGLADGDGDHATTPSDSVKWDIKEINCLTLEN